MAAKRAQVKWLPRLFRGGLTLVLLALFAVSCTSTPIVPEAASPTEPVATTPPSPTPPSPTPQSPTPLVPLPSIDALPPATDAQVRTALAIERAPLGTFVVAKPSQGIPLVHPPTFDGQQLLEIPVYDEPFGEPRVLTHRTEFDNQVARFPLLHQGQNGAPLVLRVLAGGPGDEWIKVQAPTLPHDRSVWVQSLYFDFGYTASRIEIDLAGDGTLRLIDGGSIMMETSIVKGRGSAPTPHHVTYVIGGEGSVPGYGVARIALASFLRAYGPADHDRQRNFISGNEQPELLGQAITLGEVRVPGELVLGLALLDSPQLWEHCTEWRGSLCPAQPWTPPETLIPVGNVFLTAREGAGEPFRDGSAIAVYDEPGGAKRHLIDSNSIDAIRQVVPLQHPTQFGMPGQSLHGTNQPELVGQRVSSGGIRVPNEIIDVIYAALGIVGAGVIIYDSAGSGREIAIRRERLEAWSPAITTSFITNMAAAPLISYS